MESGMARMSGPRVTAVLAFVFFALAPAGAQEPGQGGREPGDVWKAMVERAKAINEAERAGQ